jgi:hypothetical protein
MAQRGGAYLKGREAFEQFFESLLQNGNANQRKGHLTQAAFWRKRNKGWQF